MAVRAVRSLGESGSLSVHPHYSKVIKGKLVVFAILSELMEMKYGSGTTVSSTRVCDIRLGKTVAQPVTYLIKNKEVMK